MFSLPKTGSYGYAKHHCQRNEHTAEEDQTDALAADAGEESDSDGPPKLVSDSKNERITQLRTELVIKDRQIEHSSQTTSDLVGLLRRQIEQSTQILTQANQVSLSLARANTESHDGED